KDRGKGGQLEPESPPTQLKTALPDRYCHEEETFLLWQEQQIEVPPCFIVACNNTATSKLVYDFISGWVRENEDGSSQIEHGRLKLFDNYDDYGNRIPRPNTLLIDSEQLESGDALDANFRKISSEE